MRPTTAYPVSVGLAAPGQTPTALADEQDENAVYLLSKDESFHFETLIPMSESIYGGADIAPILEAARNITAGDMDSFSKVFYTLANRTKAEAQDPENAYDPVNVRDSWFSAAQYFRRADFYLHGNWDDPLINTLWEEQTAAFDKGLAALPVPGKRVRIPAGNFTIEAIWYAVDHDECTKRPTLILGNGYDGSQEDMYHTVAAPALARGWNAITYEGPGQPTVRRNQGLGFIPDWERVVTPVVDYLYSDKTSSVDFDRLALFGYSFGGYLAARAAAFEPRLSAVLLDGGLWSFYESVSSFLPPEMIQLLGAGNKTAFDKYITAMLASPNATTSTRWGIEQGLWSFKTKSPFDFLQKTKEYSVEDIIDRIKMPVWIADGEFESFFEGQAPKVKRALGDQATLHTFQGSAGYHCQAGALQELARVMFAWLNKTLKEE